MAVKRVGGVSSSNVPMQTAVPAVKNFGFPWPFWACGALILYAPRYVSVASLLCGITFFVRSVACNRRSVNAGGRQRVWMFALPAPRTDSRPVYDESPCGLVYETLDVSTLYCAVAQLSAPPVPRAHGATLRAARLTPLWGNTVPLSVIIPLRPLSTCM